MRRTVGVGGPNGRWHHAVAFVSNRDDGATVGSGDIGYGVVEGPRLEEHRAPQPVEVVAEYRFERVEEVIGIGVPVCPSVGIRPQGLLQGIGAVQAVEGIQHAARFVVRSGDKGTDVRKEVAVPERLRLAGSAGPVEVARIGGPGANVVPEDTLALPRKIGDEPLVHPDVIGLFRPHKHRVPHVGDFVEGRAKQ